MFNNCVAAKYFYAVSKNVLKLPSSLITLSLLQYKNAFHTIKQLAYNFVLKTLGVVKIDVIWNSNIVIKWASIIKLKV